MCPPHLSPPPRLPICCPCSFCSCEPAEAEKEKAGTGARTDLGLQRPRAAETPGCGPEQKDTPSMTGAKEGSDQCGWGPGYHA